MRYTKEPKKFVVEPSQHAFSTGFRDFIAKVKSDYALLALLDEPRLASSVVAIAQSAGYAILESDIFKSRSNEADQVLDGIGWAYSDRHVYFFLAP